MTADPLRALNDLPEEEAERFLRACCASSTWVAQVLASRPYATAEELFDVADRASRELSADDLEQALSAHPRIGERAEGDSAEAKLSREEKASVSDAGAATRERLRERNGAYEQRFDRVFLVRAAGRTPDEMLAELERRLGNDPETEQQEVLEQLRQITRLRLEGLLSA